MTPADATSDAPVRHLVKRYSNTRLYDTHTLTYVTATQLRALLRDEAEVIVEDAETGADVTETVLSTAR
jgi:polyhydroxyalkanoate synthesis regulator protein